MNEILRRSEARREQFEKMQLSATTRQTSADHQDQVKPPTLPKSCAEDGISNPPAKTASIGESDCSRPSDLEMGKGEDPSSDQLRAKNVLSLIALNAAIFLAALDSTIVATALPTISSDLKATGGYTWVTGAYLLSTAASTPIIGKLSDIWGRKGVMMVMVALFFLSSLMCALSIDITMLVAGRALQGIAGGGYLAMVGIITGDLFSQRERAVHFTVQMVVWSTASASGPILGGVLSQEVSWRWCFWINLPVSGLTFLALLLCLDVHNPRTSFWAGIKALDWIGVFCLVGFVLTFLLALEFGGDKYPWGSAAIICLLVFAAVLAVLFFVNECKFARYPILPSKILANRSNLASLFVGGGHTFVGMLVAFYMPLFFQSVKEASPLKSGLLLLPYALADATSGILTGVIISKTGKFIVFVWLGTAFITLSSGLLLILNMSATLGLEIGLMIVAGFAIGILFQPVLLSIHAHTEQEHVAMATAAVGTARTMSGAIAIVIGGVIFQNGMVHEAPALRAAGASESLIQRFSGIDATANTPFIRDITDATVSAAVKLAYTNSIHNIWIAAVCVAATAFLASFLVQSKILSSEHTETKTGLKVEKAESVL